ncbi:hypothetical protein BC937DRAFT_87110, partial [Endogone sp. FLAS-F59071]
PVTQGDYSALETLAKNAVKEKQPFERLVVSKPDLLEMFKHNPYKVHIINDKIPDGTSTTVYRCGPLIDLCLGPHVPHTGRIKAFSVTKNSASYFLGDANNDSLQRIYGISFPDTKQMTEYKKFIEEAAKRDHRKLGKVRVSSFVIWVYTPTHPLSCFERTSCRSVAEQELFFFHEMSPGSCFFLPHGARIYNTLVDFIKVFLVYALNLERHLNMLFIDCIINTDVRLPYNHPYPRASTLWEQSGHLENYKENMFLFDVEKEQFALKPMNCPGHCLMFGHRERSYRELPIRMADFGVLHRNEFSGALTGLTRVRRFQQDDAHIFCRHDQLEAEMSGCFDFLNNVYGIFGFDFHLKLSTRPEKYLGDISSVLPVNLSENLSPKIQMLEDALNNFRPGWEVNPGDGAFYGPKIDITISDALRRKHQCATIQLDFQLPQRFGLQYRTESSGDTDQNYSHPVIIHRAILGSVERMMAILIEHFAGKWPFWLSPRQVVVVPVTGTFFAYAQEITNKLVAAGLYADADLSDNTLNKKIRNGEITHYNFIFVVGNEEESTRSVNVRNRDDVGTKAKTETISLDDVLERLLKLKTTRAQENKI